ncbi:MAG: YkgJ family cysteine cluster protein [Acidobacteriota bacterium]
MAEPTTEQRILEEAPRLGPDSRFAFRCGPDRACFNGCCRDVSILLSPYDVLRLKRALHLDSSEFLDNYTLTLHSRERHIPAVFLRMEETSRQCPFVGAAGCQVYPQRPWACRMYPLGMAQPKSVDAASDRFYFIVSEELCRGHEGEEQSVREWIDKQGIEPFDRGQLPFLELMAHPGWDRPGGIDERQLAMCFMALYDLDRFRRFVFDTRMLLLFDVDEDRVHAIANDDEELLAFAIDWLLFSLFHEPRMRMRDPLGCASPLQHHGTQDHAHARP